MTKRFSALKEGLERRHGWHSLSRHRHAGAYISVVLRGGYEEAGDAGRFRVQAGDVLHHAPFQAHLDRFNSTGADIFNLQSSGATQLNCAFGRVKDPEAIVRAAELDPAEAYELLRVSFETAKPLLMDWPDALAADMLEDPALVLANWADAHHLSPSTISRGFGSVFGLSPTAFRAEARARRAWGTLVSCDISLSALATEGGFADQSHMTRAISSLTGRTPSRWRKDTSNRFKTGMPLPD